MPDDQHQGVSCGICLNPDEADSMVAVSIKRRFVDQPEIIPICTTCCEAIFTAVNAMALDKGEVAHHEPSDHNGNLLGAFDGRAVEAENSAGDGSPSSASADESRVVLPDRSHARRRRGGD